MRVGIIQPNYIPWRGYFDFIDDVDLFIFLDDVQYTRRDWRNRNWIKCPQGKMWLTVPVHFRRDSGQPICDTPIDYTHNWQSKHGRSFHVNYSGATFFDRYQADYLSLIESNFRTIAELNIALTSWIMGRFAITTPLRCASEFSSTRSKTDRLLDILDQVGATTYLSGPAAKDYLETDKFFEAGIGLEFKTYDYAPYPQLWGAFEAGVTALDLLFNCGPRAVSYLKSRQPNLCVVETPPSPQLNLRVQSNDRLRSDISPDYPGGIDPLNGITPLSHGGGQTSTRLR